LLINNLPLWGEKWQWKLLIPQPFWPLLQTGDLFYAQPFGGQTLDLLTGFIVEDEVSILGVKLDLYCLASV
jgi:hypothetical protein